MMPDARDKALLQDMLEYARKAVQFVEGQILEDLQNNVMLSLALERAIEIVGEAAKGVSEETRLAQPEIPWRDIIRTRDFLAHAYFKLDHAILWNIATTNLPPLLASLSRLVEPDEAKAPNGK